MMSEIDMVVSFFEKMGHPRSRAAAAEPETVPLASRDIARHGVGLERATAAQAGGCGVRASTV
jgi:hypothetical protein